MNWIEELYRPWWTEKGHLLGAPEAPALAPNRWVKDIYSSWRNKQPADSGAPDVPWEV